MSTKLHRKGTEVDRAVVPLRSLKVGKKLIQNPIIELIDDRNAVFGMEELEFGVFRELSSFERNVLAKIQLCVRLKEAITPSTHICTVTMVVLRGLDRQQWKLLLRGELFRRCRLYKDVLRAR